MRVIIAGSRDTIRADVLVGEAMKKLNGEVTEIVCGEGGNVDHAGRRWGESRGIEVTSFPANWSGFGRSAGPRRNKKMADWAAPGGVLVAIWDGFSPGTKNMISQAESAGLRIYEHLI